MKMTAVLSGFTLETTGETVFRLTNLYVLKQLLPDVTNHQYHVRQRCHNHCLIVKTDDRNFVTRQLFKDLY